MWPSVAVFESWWGADGCAWVHFVLMSVECCKKLYVAVNWLQRVAKDC